MIPRESVNRAPQVPTPEAEWVARCRTGDREAFDQLVLRHQDRIYNAVVRFVGDRDRALDLAQRTFLNAFLKIRQFESKSSFGTWLYRIAMNLCLSEARSRRGEPGSLAQAGGRREEGTEYDPPDPGSGPTGPLESRETREAVQAAIRSLDAEHRAVIVLRDIEDRSYVEIAEALDLPVGTVRSRLHRARLELKASLDKMLGTSA